MLATTNIVLFSFILIFFSSFFLTEAENVEFPELQFILVNRNDPSQVANFTIYDSKIIKHEFFNQNIKTIFYVFGYTNVYSNLLDLISLMAKSKYRQNFILLDYGNYSSANSNMGYIQDFSIVIERSKKISQLVGKQMWKIFRQNLQKFELVGTSLGAHMSAYINRAIAIEPTNYQHMKIPIITALDPAGPLFFPPVYFNDNQPLNAKDASKVIVVHTDMLYFGASVKIGTLNFLINGGSNQPGCPPINFSDPTTSDNLCSHRRATRFYAYAISKDYNVNFPAVKCDSYLNFQNNSCDYSSIAFLGQPLRYNQIGDFYLQTSSKLPYSLGVNGLKYNNKIN